jgi:hypothetical protein
LRLRGEFVAKAHENKKNPYINIHYPPKTLLTQISPKENPLLNNLTVANGK